MKRLPLPAVIILIVAALAVALMVGLLSVRADCPEPTPPGGCGVDTLPAPTATAPAATSEPYPPPYPGPYPAPEYLPLVAGESYP